MLSEQENSLLTRTGPATPAGELLRRYWQPAALSEELPPGGPPLMVQLMGEEFVLFRDEQGRPGLLGLHCSHRAADLSYGRIEDGGLRCLYHGWLYDIHGTCLEQPGEPAEGGSGMPDPYKPGSVGARHASPFREKIHHPAYSCQEVAGIVFAYLGPGELPLLPQYELHTAPDAYRLRPTKSLNECNYLQGNEGNIDPVHLSFLHQVQPAERASGGRVNISAELCARDRTPLVEAEETEFGVRVYAVRRAAPGQVFVRITNFVMPNLCAIPGGTGQDGYQMDWHVPIDDTSHWKYTLNLRRSAPMGEQLRTALRAELTPDFNFIRNKRNRYLQDRESMNSLSFAGLGSVFQVHDKFVIEGEGLIQDRTLEHLSSTDKAVILARQMLLRAIRDVQEGVDPRHVIREPEANEFLELVVRSEVVPDTTDWRNYWKMQPAPAG